MNEATNQPARWGRPATKDEIIRLVRRIEPTIVALGGRVDGAIPPEDRYDLLVIAHGLQRVLLREARARHKGAKRRVVASSPKPERPAKAERPAEKPLAHDEARVIEGYRRLSKSQRAGFIRALNRVLAADASIQAKAA